MLIKNVSREINFSNETKKPVTFTIMLPTLFSVNC